MQLLNLPNKITISRIAVVPVILVLMAIGTKISCLVAAGLFLLAAFSDMLDGYLARRSNQITSLGKLLDPLADKVLVSSVLIMFVETGWAPAWVVILIICRELLVTGLRSIAAEEGVVIAADKYGKAKTVTQIVAIVPLIIHYSWFGIPMALIGTVVLYIALILTVFSGANYFKKFFYSVNKEAKGTDAQTS